ncbi:hypothetical protein SQV88_004438 [Salmonella enterica]|nr:hypothetical protein [Salmonella enterica]
MMSREQIFAELQRVDTHLSNGTGGDRDKLLQEMQKLIDKAQALIDEAKAKESARYHIAKCA